MTHPVPAEPPPAQAHSTSIVHALVLVVASLAAYSTSFAGVFVFDDLREIVDETRIHSLTPLTNHLLNFCPLVSLSLAINWAIGGADPFGYHVFNFVVHACAALVLYGLVRRTLSLPRFANTSRTFRPDTLALAIALLWAVHPLGTQAVTYIVQRAESMMALFYLLALYCVVRTATSSARGWRVAAVAACAAGMGSKAVMITAPITAFAFDALCIAGSWRAAWRARWPMYVAMLSMWIVVAITGRAAGVVTLGVADDSVGFGTLDVSLLDYLLSQPAVILHYLRLSLVPWPQALDYRWPVATGFTGVVVPAIVVLALLLVTLRSCLRGRAAGFLGLAFFLVLAPTSSIVPIADLANEHRMYLPLAAVVTAAVLGSVLWLERSGAQVRPVGAGILVAIAIALSVATASRNRVYHSNIALWRDSAEVAPHNARAWANLSSYLAAEGSAHFEESLEAARRAADLAPDTIETWRALATAQNRLDRYAEAVQSLQRAVDLEPDNAELRHELAVALEDLGLFRDAIVAYESSLEIAGRRWRTLDALGQLVGKCGDSERAIQLVRRAISINPRNAELRQHLGVMLADRGDFDGAIAAFRKAVDLKPDSSAMQFALGRAVDAAGHADDAVAIYDRIARQDPESRGLARHEIAVVRTRELLKQRAGDVSAIESANEDTLRVMARSLIDLERYDEALVVQRRYVAIKPEDAAGWVAIGDVYLGLDRIQDAFSAYSHARTLDPQNHLAALGTGRTAVLLGDAPRAVRDLEAVLAVDSSLFEAQVHLGMAYLATQRVDDAIQRFGAATRLRPASADARQRLADAMMSIGRLDDAIVEYRRVLRANPKNLEVRNRLEKAVKRQLAGG